MLTQRKYRYTINGNKTGKEAGYFMKRALKIYLWPVWFLALFGQAKSFKSNPIIGSKFLNFMGLHLIRVLAARLSAHLRWLFLSAKMPRTLRQTYQRDGFVVLPDFLGASTLEALRAEIAAYEGPARQMLQGNTATQRILLDDKALGGRPALSRLAADNRLLDLLKYAGAKAVRPILYIQRIRNGVRDGNADPQKKMHADTFHPTMKAWLFLEDVQEEDGPFTYVRGSHRMTWRRFKWEYKRSRVAAHINDGYSEKGSFRASDADLAEMGLPAPEGLTAAAGTLVIANTNGFHGRGQARDGANRIEIWAYSRHNPFSPWPGLGIKARAQLEHKILHAFWRRKDRTAAAKGGRASWHLIDAADMLD